MKESFIFNKKDKTPANVVLRLSSEFEQDSKKKDLKYFIEQSSLSILEKYFITEELVRLYKSNNIEEFIAKREELISNKEREFVANYLQIDYTKTSAETLKAQDSDNLNGKFMRRWADFENLLNELTRNPDKFVSITKVYLLWIIR